MPGKSSGEKLLNRAEPSWAESAVHFRQIPLTSLSP